MVRGNSSKLQNVELVIGWVTTQKDLSLMYIFLTVEGYFSVDVMICLKVCVLMPDGPGVERLLGLLRWVRGPCKGAGGGYGEKLLRKRWMPGTISCGEME